MSEHAHELMELWKRIGLQRPQGGFRFTAKEWNEVYEAIARAQSENAAPKREIDAFVKREVRALNAIDENATLKDEIEALRKLAYDYIQAYERLAFGDALLTEENDEQT